MLEVHTLSIFNDMINAKAYLDDTVSSYKVRKDLFDRVIELIESKVYFDCKNFDVLIKNYSQGDEYLSSILDITEAGVRKMKSRASKALYSVLGRDIFMLITRGSDRDLKVVDGILSLAEMKILSEDVILRDVKLGLLKNLGAEDRLSSYRLEDCVEEIKFLHRYSQRVLGESLSELDTGKILYLLDLLDNKASLIEKYRLVKTLFPDLLD